MPTAKKFQLTLIGSQCDDLKFELGAPEDLEDEESNRSEHFGLALAWVYFYTFPESTKKK